MRNYRISNMLIVMFVVIVGFIGVSRADLNDGLVAYYPFNGNADDESGNGNHGIVNGAKLTEDRFGKGESAYNFDGINDYVTIKQFQMSYNQISVSAWVFLSSNTNGSPEIIGIYNGNPKEHALQLEIGDSSVGYNSIMWDATTEKTRLRSSNNSFSIGSWHHIAATYNGSKSSIYYDGNLLANRNASGSYSLSNAIVNIGTETTANNSFWKGSIDEIRIYNRALSESEIQELYRNDAESDSDCADINEALTLDIPCLEFEDMQYHVLFDLYTNPADIDGIYFKFSNISNSDKVVSSCALLENNLNINNIPCFMLDDTQYKTSSVFLEYYPNSRDTNGLYWKLAVSKPNAPSNLSATALSSSSIEITWRDNSDNETGFYLYRKNGSSWSNIKTLGAGTTSYTDTGLTANTTYYYYVASYNSAGISPFNGNSNGYISAITQDKDDQTLLSNLLNKTWSSSSSAYKYDGTWGYENLFKIQITFYDDYTYKATESYYYFYYSGIHGMSSKGYSGNFTLNGNEVTGDEFVFMINSTPELDGVFHGKVDYNF